MDMTTRTSTANQCFMNPALRNCDMVANGDESREAQAGRDGEVV